MPSSTSEGSILLSPHAAVEGATVTNAELQLEVHLLEERSTGMAACPFLSALPIEARFVLR